MRIAQDASMLRCMDNNTTTETGQTDPPTETPEGWQGVTDDALAAWAIDRIAAYTAERDRIRANAKAYIEQIQADAIADEAPLNDKIGWFTGEVIAYYHGLPDPPKTYKLPNGQIVRRAGRESTQVTDEEAFIEWAATNAPAAVKLSPLVSGLPKWGHTDDGLIVSPDGEPVPGVRVTRGDDTVTVRPAGRPS